MVLINDKKFACGTCIKGHRVSGCTHTDRPLFEVKKKGRPATQCQHCKDKRKAGNHAGGGGQVHTKCVCSEVKAPDVIMPGSTTISSTQGSASTQSSENSIASPAQIQSTEMDYGTRKGVPGSKATFPNGLKDVHDMAAAADALSGMGDEEQGLKVAERKVANLLNPCHCQSGGPCKCCQPKRNRAESLRAPSPSPSGSRTPTHGVTDGLIEMFKSKATTSTTPPEGSCCSSGPPQLNVSTNPTWAQLMQPKGLYLSPENMHHPAHTSPHVHKTKLYSPYSTPGQTTPRYGAKRREASPAGHRVGGWASSSTAPRPPPPKLRPISDMNKLLGAVFKDDGSMAETIPRSALGLPGIKAFDAMAANGGVKFESMDIDVDVPIQFPTDQDVVIGACTCGDDCACFGCATHGIPPRTGSTDGHVHDGGCGENCKSSFDCADHLSLPSGITSIGHLLSLAAANVPPPAQKRPADLSGHAHDTRILPTAVQHSEDAARSLGLVNLKPLECCNGRCQCAPGQCVCEKECCGCCLRCACDEDGDSKMDGSRPHDAPSTASSCCSTAPDSQARSTHSSSGSTGTVVRRPSPADSRTATPPLNSPMTVASRNSGSPPLLSPEVANRPSRQPSPNPSGKQSSASTLRRASSTVAQSNAGSAAIARRATVTHGSGAHRSGSTGKHASKALALHATPNHPQSSSTHSIHPRPILPKPPSHNSQQNVSKNAQGSRIATPIHSGQTTAPSSAQTSRHSSPAVTPTTLDAPQPQIPLPEAVAQNSRAMQMFNFSDIGMSSQNPSLGSLAPQGSAIMPPLQDQSGFQHAAQSLFGPSFADFTSEAELVAFIDQISAQAGSQDVPSFTMPSSSEGSLDLPLITPDPSVDGHNFEDSNERRSTGDSAALASDISDIDSNFLSMFDSVINPESLQQTETDPSLSSGALLSQPTYPPLGHSTAYARYQMFADRFTPSLPMNPTHSASMDLGSRLDVFNAAADGGFALSLSELYAGRQQNSAPPSSQMSKPEPVYRQLPPDLQRALGQNLALSSGRDVPSSQSSTSSSHSPGSSNLIDLSKPLNASDVERILRALQDQQARQSPSGSGAPGGSASLQPHTMTPSAGDALDRSGRAGLSVSIPTPKPSPVPPQQQQPQQPEGPIFNVNFNPFTATDDVLEDYLRLNPDYTGDPPDGVPPIELDSEASGFKSLQGDMMWDGGNVGIAPDQNAFVYGIAAQGSGA